MIGALHNQTADGQGLTELLTFASAGCDCGLPSVFRMLVVSEVFPRCVISVAAVADMRFGWKLM